MAPKECIIELNSGSIRLLTFLPRPQWTNCQRRLESIVPDYWKTPRSILAQQCMLRPMVRAARGQQKAADPFAAEPPAVDRPSCQDL